MSKVLFKVSFKTPREKVPTCCIRGWEIGARDGKIPERGEPGRIILAAESLSLAASTQNFGFRGTRSMAPWP